MTVPSMVDFVPLHHEKVNPERLVNRNSTAPFVFRWSWVKFHLNFLCGRCYQNTRKLRDLQNSGQCWWWENWKRGNYKIPFWMGWREFRRLKKIRRERVKKGQYFPVVGSVESAIFHTLEKIFQKKS